MTIIPASDPQPERPSVRTAAAVDHLAAAERLLVVWDAKLPDGDGLNYVDAGRAAINSIEAACIELHHQRARLVDELHRDEDERAARVDALVAKYRTEVTR